MPRQRWSVAAIFESRGRTWLSWSSASSADRAWLAFPWLKEIGPLQKDLGEEQVRGDIFGRGP